MMRTHECFFNIIVLFIYLMVLHGSSWWHWLISDFDKDKTHTVWGWNTIWYLIYFYQINLFGHMDSVVCDIVSSTKGIKMALYISGTLHIKDQRCGRRYLPTLANTYRDLHLFNVNTTLESAVSAYHLINDVNPSATANVWSDVVNKTGKHNDGTGNVGVQEDMPWLTERIF